MGFLIGGSINGAPGACLVELDTAYLDEPARPEEALLSCKGGAREAGGGSDSPWESVTSM